MLTADDIIALVRPVKDRASDDAWRAALARLGGEVGAVDVLAEEQWPPPNIDRRQNYWEWMTLDEAAAKGPYKRTKLQSMRFLVSMTDGRARWFSLRRIWQVHGSDEPRQNSALAVKT